MKISAAAPASSIAWTNIDAPWLLRLYNGNFGVLNLQPIYSPSIGVLTLVVVVSGIALSTMGWLLQLATSAQIGGAQVSGRRTFPGAADLLRWHPDPGPE
jgi:hypothetical protein